MASHPTGNTLVVIRPNQRWFRLDWRELVAYRDLLWLLVRRDFTAKYKQTVLGPLWIVVNPLIMTLIFTVVFNRVIGVPTDGVPPTLFYLCGMLSWTYFATVLAATSNALSGNAALFSKVYFPRLIPPVAVTISSLLGLVIQLATFMVMYFQDQASGTTKVAPPHAGWLIFPLLVLHMGVLALGVGLILSSLTAKYRDLHHIHPFLVQMWMYASPIIYPLSRIPEKWQWVAVANPMTPLVEAMRHTFLGVGTINLTSYLTSLAISFGLLLIGVMVYQRNARTFVDTV